MSETILYGIKNKKRSVYLEDFENSHGFGTVIWGVYFDKYLNMGNIYPMEDDYKKLWKLSRDNNLPNHHRTILMATYDYSIITKDFFDKFIEDLLLWNNDFGEDLFEKNYVNHVPDILKFLQENRKLINRFDSLGIQTTSICDSHYDVGWGKIRRRGVDPRKLWNIYDYI